MKYLILSISFIFLGLMTACNNAPKGEKATTTAAKAVEKKAANKTYAVTKGSTLNWSGSKIAGTHTGTINVSNGSINVDNGAVTGGKFTIDMSSIVCTDLKAGEGKEDLEGHLKAPDFFDVAAHPNATFEITSVTGSNVTGNLTMKDVTKSITFPATIKVAPGGVMVTSSDFTINRTDWGIKYGSATFIDGLKDKAINDNIGISINLKAT